MISAIAFLSALHYQSREMKFVLTLLALSAVVFTACERHKFEDTKVLHEQHGAHDDSHGAAHDGADATEHKTEAH